MFFKKKQKRKLKKALNNSNLQEALSRASHHHYKKYKNAINDIHWQEYRKKARVIREENVKILPQLIQKFSEEAKKAGAYTYQVSTPDEALHQIEKIARQKKARLIVKSKSMVSEEIHLNDFLEKRGFRVVETDLGEWIIQLSKERPSHITAPALHKTKEEVAELLSHHLNTHVAPDIKEIVRTAREKLRQYFIKADIGISGANFAVAESGTLVIISNEGNARLVTSLPPVHIALVTTEKFVQTLEQATMLIKALTLAASGLKLTSYVSFITGPSRTADIEKQLVIGAHGPRELHIVILDNNRLKTARDEELKEVLYCLKCGGCMLVCPVFQTVGGHIFGGPVYHGGIGILMTAINQPVKKIASLLDFCADCKKCDAFCPVGIPTSEIILKLKNKKDLSLFDRTLSAVLRKRFTSEGGARILSVLQKIWQKNGYLENLPFSWAKGKSLPVLNPKNSAPLPGKNGKKVYFFQGCLVKYFFPEIRESVFSLLAYCGFNTVSPPDQRCCGAPSFHLGHKKDVHKLALKNLKSIERENPDYILTVCPAGNSILKKIYPRLEPKYSLWKDRIYDFTEFLVTRRCLPEKMHKEKNEVFYHFPCHYLNDLKMEDKPKKLIHALGFNLKEEEEPFTCCGFCGIFSFKNPDISARMWEMKKKKILENRASFIATDCPGCLFQLKANLKNEDPPFTVLHTAELCSKALRENSLKTRGSF